MKKMSISANHEALLIQAKILLHKIRTKPLLSTNEYHHLHTSDNNIEKFSYDTLFQWVRSTRNSIERYFLLQNNFEHLQEKYGTRLQQQYKQTFIEVVRIHPYYNFTYDQDLQLVRNIISESKHEESGKTILFHQIDIYIYIEYTVIMIRDKNLRYILEARGQ